MALDNLNLVTKTLKNLIENYFEVSHAWSDPIKPPEVFTMPPDKLNGKGEVVGIYLYHVSEDVSYKNIPPPGNDQIPVRYTPMGLNLYYLLTAHSDLDSNTGSENEQKAFTIAMKALRGYPIIDQNTKINDVKLFDAGIGNSDDRFRIDLMPINQTEAVSYWTAGSSPLRLSAYYRVSVVLLEPEESKSHAGRVLSYGVQTFVGGGPRIDSCRNILSFKLSGKTEMNTVELRPAQVPFGNEVLFHGSGFSGGGIEFLLKNSIWEQPYTIDSAWGLAVSDKGAGITIQEKIKTFDENGNPKDITVSPGIYSATVKVVKQVNLSDGSWRNIEHLSNECPFAITPKINIPGNIISAQQNDIVDIKGHIFSEKVQVSNNPPTYKELITIQVYVGNSKYQPGTDPGCFIVVDAATIQIHLEKIMPKGYYPLRIFANGAESSPNWVSIT
jgi:hypothetical protein